MEMKKFLIGIIVTIVIFFTVDIYLNWQKEDQKEKDEIRHEQTESVNAKIKSGLKVGDKAPNFILKTLSGEKVNLSDLIGKKVILNFWATWCPPCREEMPAMEQVYQKYKNQEVEIVAVNSTVGKETVDKVKKFTEELNITFPIPLDVEAEVFKVYQIYGLPTTYFINTKGVIHFVHFGPMDESFMIQELEKMD